MTGAWRGSRSLVVLTILIVTGLTRHYNSLSSAVYWKGYVFLIVLLRVTTPE
jgi:hypothetical protein